MLTRGSRSEVVGRWQAVAVVMMVVVLTVVLVRFITITTSKYVHVLLYPYYCYPEVPGTLKIRRCRIGTRPGAIEAGSSSSVNLGWAPERKGGKNTSKEVGRYE